MASAGPLCSSEDSEAGRTRAASISSDASDSAGELTRKPAKLYFSGTGTSSGVPVVSCLVKRPVTCETCSRAQFSPCSHDRRGNTGAIIQVPTTKAEGFTTIAIDVGKHFWNSALELFAAEGSLTTLDAVVLTHDHLDAVGGLDDMRDFCRGRETPLPVYCSEATLVELTRMYPFLVDASKATGGGQVASLDFRPFVPGSAFDVCGVRFMPFNVWHGPDYQCTAFRVGSLVWMSDVSSIPDDVRHHIAGADVVVLDTLWLKPEAHKSHFGLEQALEEVKTGFGVDTRPRRTLLIGMCHLVPHDETNTALRRRGFPDVQLAYDGQIVPLEVDVVLKSDLTSTDEAVEE